MVDLLACDEDAPVGHPDLLALVALRVEAEDSRRADEQVIDVRVAGADGDGVQHSPFGTEARELAADRLLAEGSGVPAGVIRGNWAQAEEAGEGAARWAAALSVEDLADDFVAGGAIGEGSCHRRSSRSASPCSPTIGMP